MGFACTRLDLYGLLKREFLLLCLLSLRYRDVQMDDGKVLYQQTPDVMMATSNCDRVRVRI